MKPKHRTKKKKKKKQQKRSRRLIYLQPQGKDRSTVSSSGVNAPSLTVAGRIRAPATTGGSEGRDNGFRGHSLHQLPLDGNHTRYLFLHLPLHRRA
ncbi:hypothetical protein CARUB_v10010744mg [Capsella rubella]|uniref:Uncharacterized protein n=1 Tax=Capsella rubella TaxID=81985 RepID=R0GSD9_9BRAS|nr:hypothetical protein CARUB_v10010744mg [Capsella rubella]